MSSSPPASCASSRSRGCARIAYPWSRAAGRPCREWSQRWLASLVLAQRGKLSQMRPAFEDDARLAALACCLRLAVIFYRSRRSLKLPKLKLTRKGKGMRLEVPGNWLADHSLVALALEA